MNSLKTAILLTLATAALSACGMMRDESHTASNDKSDWFQYAYYSSSVTLQHDDDKPVKAPLIKLY